MFEVLFTCVFENISPEHGWALRTGALAISKIVNGLIEQSLTEAAPHTATVSPLSFELDLVFRRLTCLFL